MANSPTKQKQGVTLNRKPAKQDDPEQSKRFLEAAQEAGADRTPKGADRAFKAVVKPRKRQKEGP
jgi:hypothetical protein